MHSRRVAVPSSSEPELIFLKKVVLAPAQPERIGKKVRERQSLHRLPTLHQSHPQNPESFDPRFHTYRIKIYSSEI